MIRICSNCGNVCRINEYVKHCSKCGFIFIDLIIVMSNEDIIRKSNTRRTGKDVDRLDG